MARRRLGVRIQHTVRIPVNVHRTLVGAAQERKWSLNQYIVHVLEQAATDRTAPPVGEQMMSSYDDEGVLL